MAKQKVMKEPATKEKEYIFVVSEEAVNLLDNLFATSLQAHAQGVLDYKSAFFKTMEAVKNSIQRKEV